MLILQLVKSNILTNKIRSFLTLFSISVSILLILVITSLSMQLTYNIIKNIQFYDVLIGKKGSSTQLALNTFFFYDAPLGNIDYKYYELLKSDPRINSIVPIGMGDNYKGYKIIGTTLNYFEGLNLDLMQGEWFKSVGQAVIGNTVAKKVGLGIGDQFTSMHGITDLSEHFHDEAHDNFVYIVSGILEFSGTPNDNAIFTDIHSVWRVHGIETEHDHQEQNIEHNTNEDKASHAHEEEMITAILVKSKSLGDAFILTQEYNDKQDIQAINPASTIRKIMNSINIGQNVVSFIAGICIALSIITLFIVMLSASAERNKDVALLRVLGAKRKSIFHLVVIETFILSFIGCVFGLLLSRIFIFGFNEFFKANIGLNFSAFSISMGEIYILVTALFLCTVSGIFPGIIVYRKDAIEYL